MCALRKVYLCEVICAVFLLAKVQVSLQSESSIPDTVHDLKARKGGQRSQSDIDGCQCEDNEGGSDDSGEGIQKHHGFGTGP